jgi:hypothetical protein
MKHSSKSLGRTALAYSEMPALPRSRDKGIARGFRPRIQLAEEDHEGECNVNALQCAVDERSSAPGLEQPWPDLRFILGCTYIAANRSARRPGGEHRGLALLLASAPEAPQSFMEELGRRQASSTRP